MGLHLFELSDWPIEVPGGRNRIAVGIWKLVEKFISCGTSSHNVQRTYFKKNIRPVILLRMFKLSESLVR